MKTEHYRRSFTDRLNRTQHVLLTGDHVRLRSTGAQGVIVMHQSLAQVLSELDEASATELLTRLNSEYDDVNDYKVYFVLTNGLTVRAEGGDIEPDNLSR